MMTRASYALFGLALAFSGAALAADSGFYLGGSLGRTSTDAPGLDDGGSYKLFGGFKARGFSVEAGYVDLGDFDSQAAPGAQVSVDGVQLSAIGEFFLSAQVDAYGSVGVYNWTLDETSGPGDDGTSLTFGAGLKVNMSDNLGVRLGWERISDISGGDFDFVSLGALYRFGEKRRPVL